MIHTYSTTWKSESHELIRVVIGTSLTTFDVAKLLKFLIAAYIFPCCGFGPVLDRIWIWPFYNQGPDHLFSSWNGVDKIFIYVYMMYLFFKKISQGKDVSVESDPDPDPGSDSGRDTVKIRIRNTVLHLFTSETSVIQHLNMTCSFLLCLYSWAQFKSATAHFRKLGRGSSWILY